jgi:hypothetical protein
MIWVILIVMTLMLLLGFVLLLDVTTDWDEPKSQLDEWDVSDNWADEDGRQ